MNLLVHAAVFVGVLGYASLEQAPTETPAETPAETPTETPEEAPAKTPAETPAGETTGAPPDGPTDVSGESSGLEGAQQTDGTDVEPEAQDSAGERPAVKNSPAPSGGFGTVESMTTYSDVYPQYQGRAVPVDEEPPPPPMSQRVELALRLEAGYGRLDLGNTRPLDHQGLWARAVLQYYPWVSARSHLGLGFELAYQYQGLNRRLEQTASFESSRANTQSITLGLAGRLRPHPQWFGFQPSIYFGAADLAGEEFLLGEIEVVSPERSARVTVGGSLALCTWWDAICITGAIDYVPAAGGVALADEESVTANLRGVHVGVGVDLGRLIQRSYQTGG